MNTPVPTLCGSLSRYPVGTGAAMHNAGYRALGLAFTYVPFACSDLPACVNALRALGVRGAGVSMPFKEDVVPLLDALDPLAVRMGAVNTIVNDGGRLTGFNTDGVGALRALEEARPAKGTRVLLLGAGGAAKAIAHTLVDAGALVTIANRDATKGAQLAAASGANHLDLPLRSLAEVDVVINATSVGMKTGGDEERATVVAEALLRRELIVMDIVYKPFETPLIQAARSCGAAAIHGGRMLLHQAARQFELYTGVTAPLEAMDAALQRELAST
jgi:shikimate dehydrogenase